jgi:UPF0716 protein FxsA
MPVLAPVLMLLALALPLLEVAVFIKVAGLIGFGPTLLIVLATGFVGASILRDQGFHFLNLAVGAVRDGQSPLEPMLESALRGFAGGCLLLPGLIGDTIGAVLMWPWLRRRLARALHDSILPGMARTRPVFTDEPRAPPQPGDRRPKGDGPVIDGEFKRLDEE